MKGVEKKFSLSWEEGSYTLKQKTLMLRKKEIKPASTCCFIVLVSHSSSFPGTWFMLLPPELTAEKSTWEMGLWAAAEQTKEAPLGLQASERTLKHSKQSALPLSQRCLKHNTQLWALPLRPCKTGCTVKESRMPVLRF